MNASRTDLPSGLDNVRTAGDIFDRCSWKKNRTDHKAFHTVNQFLTLILVKKLKAFESPLQYLNKIDSLETRF